MSVGIGIGLVLLGLAGCIFVAIMVGSGAWTPPWRRGKNG